MEVEITEPLEQKTSASDGNPGEIFCNEVQFESGWLANEFMFAADGEFHEDRGIPVDVESPVYDLAYRQAGTDPASTTAVELLRNAGADEQPAASDP